MTRTICQICLLYADSSIQDIAHRFSIFPLRLAIVSSTFSKRRLALWRFVRLQIIGNDTQATSKTGRRFRAYLIKYRIQRKNYKAIHKLSTLTTINQTRLYAIIKCQFIAAIPKKFIVPTNRRNWCWRFKKV